MAQFHCPGDTRLHHQVELTVRLDAACRIVIILYPLVVTNHQSIRSSMGAEIKQHSPTGLVLFQQVIRADGPIRTTPLPDVETYDIAKQTLVEYPLYELKRPDETELRLQGPRRHRWRR